MLTWDFSFDTSLFETVIVFTSPKSLDFRNILYYIVYCIWRTGDDSMGYFEILTAAFVINTLHIMIYGQPFMIVLSWNRFYSYVY